MTVQEFYDWCKEENALDYELVVSSTSEKCTHRVCRKNDNICFYNVRKHVEINAWKEMETDIADLEDISELKGENKECPYFDYEIGTCRRSERQKGEDE